jgi:glycosyltransferase 2 family protein
MKPATRKLLKKLPPVLGLLVLVGIISGLHGVLKHVRPQDVFTALRAISWREVVHALLLLGASFGLMMVYDVPGILFARRLVRVPGLTPRRVALAAFCAYALSHVLGAPAISAAAIRVRLYAQWMVPPAGIARIIALSGSTFSIGLSAMFGVVLLLQPMDIPLFGHAVPPWLLRAVGAALVAFLLFYVLAAQKRGALTILGRNITLPGRRLACLQVTLSCADIVIACAILFAVLPATPDLTYPRTLGIYLAAFAGGLFSGLPGGIGVFDSVLLLGLTFYLPASTVLGAILLFRLLYFLGPAAAAALCYAGHEVWVNLGVSRDRKRAADDSAGR